MLYTDMYVVCVCCDRYVRVCCFRICCCMPLLISSYLFLSRLISSSLTLTFNLSYTFFTTQILFLPLIAHNLFRPSTVIPVPLNILHSAFSHTLSSPLNISSLLYSFTPSYTFFTSQYHTFFLIFIHSHTILTTQIPFLPL
jgi:hypothetical protein